MNSLSPLELRLEIETILKEKFYLTWKILVFFSFCILIEIYAQSLRKLISQRLPQTG